MAGSFFNENILSISSSFSKAMKRRYPALALAASPGKRSNLPLSNFQQFPDPSQSLGKFRILLNPRFYAANNASRRAVSFYLELLCDFLEIFASDRSSQIYRDISRLIRDSPPYRIQIRIFDSIICRNGSLDGFDGDRREHFRFRHFRADFGSEESLFHCLDEIRTSKDGRKFFQRKYPFNIRIVFQGHESTVTRPCLGSILGKFRKQRCCVQPFPRFISG